MSSLTEDAPDSAREKIAQWLQALDRCSYYELLSVSCEAGEREIQAAFHSFSLHFHPDRFSGGDGDLVESVSVIYRRGAEAYGVLRDTKLRARYDLALDQGKLRLVPGHTSGHAHLAESELVQLARTKAGQLRARQIERALSEGRLDEAELLLQRAELEEGANSAFLELARALIVDRGGQRD